MKIYSMTATFGKLEHATLTLKPGLNIIEAPNEWGKSTWCAFLAAMLYGIDSRAHSATKAGLADKARYDPWSGQLMSGRMEICWNGRDITIERSSTKRSQLRQFRAFDSHTGAVIEELTADNCGQQLLGVEKEVFQRAGFIRLSDLPVTQNEALRRRLNDLVTTGDESGAADKLAQQLNKLKNECRANRSKGLLPQAQAERALLEQKLSRLAQLQAETEKLAALQQRQEQEYQALLSEQTALTQAATRSRQETLSRLQKLRQSRADKEAQRRALQAPAIPEPFQGLSPQDGSRLARTDQMVYWQACAERRSPLRLVLSALPALLGLGCLWIPDRIIGGCLWLVFILCSMVLISAERSRQKRAAATANALAEKYGSLPPEEWESRIFSLLTEQAQYDAGLLACEREQAALDNTIGQLMQALDEAPAASASAGTARQLAECEQALRQLHLQQGRCQGQMDALGHEADLRQQLAQVTGRIEKLECTLSAITLAQETLAQATAQLQSRFAPRITQRSKALFGRLTGGRYDRLSLSEDLTLQAGAEGEDVLRGSLWRSDGTVDQLYLALRLAVAEELTPNAPLVLDDALVRFDDDRLKAAMEILQETAQRKQVILFTCQSREQQCLNDLLI